MSAYCVLSGEDASRYLTEREGSEPIPLSDLVRVVGEGELIPMKPVESLQQVLHQLKDHFPETLKQGEGGRFEREACEHVHRALSEYPIATLADPEFWTWLSVAWFADIIEWRFGSYPNPAKYSNYGIGQSSESLLYRLWLRGEIGYDPDLEDPYELARVGDQDLWRSHIIRQGYASSREVARALLLLQSGRLERTPLSVKGIRELAKRIRRLRANVFLEVLSAPKATALVLDLSKEL